MNHVTATPPAPADRRRRITALASATLAASLVTIGLVAGAAPASASASAGTPVRMVSTITDRVLVVSVDSKNLNDPAKTRAFFTSKQKADELEDRKKGSTTYETWWVAQNSLLAIPQDGEAVHFRSEKTFNGQYMCLDSTYKTEVYPHVCGGDFQTWRTAAGACSGTTFLTFQNAMTYKWIRDFKGKANVKNCNHRALTLFPRG
jgi:hypothetical protein